jgi:hypothetical protein
MYDATSEGIRKNIGDVAVKHFANATRFTTKFRQDLSDWEDRLVPPRVDKSDAAAGISRLPGNPWRRPETGAGALAVPVASQWNLSPARSRFRSMSRFTQSRCRLEKIEPFTGNRARSQDDNGRILRCEDSGNVTVTVSNFLMEGFNVGFAQWGSGTITLSAGSGATKRAGGTATAGQYQHGSLIVVKNSDGASAEYIVSGDFA